MEEIKDTIKAFIAQNILFSHNGYPYSDDASFSDESITDSTNMLELVLFVEETFGITIQDQEIVPDNFDSVNKLADFVRRRTSSVATAQ